ncbi:hypothetical protein TVAG_339070 [Trichomonas vaginalis G3]|uniref:Importin N-terminal domain-containing protein n=1 Tax=Trichomonas vaginalis (strain ATCC PRA-98 / G3) TaxID=412133 RepID=A2FMS0_TRIV3|nr:armadillo (ARM) repeat-containing protein family [Trichomonas vaginalis G3]EAX93784.1 hypothetical protein TVAG_339070 [Trichomonas vaginalis G3]KAI5527831.1 armadillo (ARM) repeat-containing protein family [Trichomonas vaginalis G3]|eukprot:XP_001306714.1 hypothetical protein [Trichomonas vaginalis G3]
MESLLDADLIQHLKGMFEAALNPNVQGEIYSNLQSMIESEPNISFDILAILSDETISEQIRFVAVATLRNYHKCIHEDILPVFLQHCFSYLESVIDNPESVFVLQLQALYITLFDSYSELFYDNPNSAILDLLSKDNTASIGLQCIRDQIQKDNFPNEDFLQFLLKFIEESYAPTNLCEQSLEIITQILLKKPETYLEFGAQHIMPAIDQFAAKYKVKALSQSFAIIGILFYHTGESDLGELIANLIRTQSQNVLINLMETFYNFDNLPFDENIVTALFYRLAEEDDNSGEEEEYNLSLMYQYVLHNLSCKYCDEVNEIIIPLLTSEANDAQVIRTLSIIDIETDDPYAFIPLFVQHLNDELRGDSVLCLLNICQYDPSLSASVIDVIMPLMLDDDSDVRDKVYFTMKGILPCDNAKPDWLVPLFNAVKSLPETATVIQIFAQYLDCNISFRDADIAELIEYFVEPFLDDNCDHILQRTIAIILSQLLQKLESEFTQDPAPIIERATQLLTVDFIMCNDLYESLCGLVDNLYTKVGSSMNEQSYFHEFVDAMTHVMPSRWNSLTKEESFSFMANLAKNAPELTSPIISRWLVVTAFCLERTAINSIATISNFWIQHIRQFDSQHTMALTSGVCNTYAKRFAEVESIEPLFELLSHCVTHLQEFGPIEQNIIDFYNALHTSLYPQNE